MSPFGAALFAHGGHTALEDSFWHYMLSMDHMFPVIMFLLIITLAMAMLRHIKLGSDE